MVEFSQKQKTVWRNTIEKAHRWNISSGATRSGKTYLDYYKIPQRVRSSGDGLIVLLGNTQGTLNRNILDPMREIWTPSLVGFIRNDNRFRLFGRDCYALGADKVSQVAKIQGAGIAYCYGDEIATWHEDVFNMLKSRLDKPGSCFDGTTNPTNPTSWIKKFLDSDADIYHMGFCIDDNPFLSPEFVDNLKKEYRGTVYYDRFINGLWKAAEGVIYRLFADNPEQFILDEYPKDIAFTTIGVDFGGNKSAHSFVCTGFSTGMKQVVKLKEYYRKEIISPDVLAADFVKFTKECQQNWKIIDCRADSAEQVLIAGLQKSLIQNRIPLEVNNALKKPITERIRLDQSLMGLGRYKVMRSCPNLIQALQDAVWDSKQQEDVRLDNGTTMIDPLDASEYSTEPFIDDLLYRG